jgi:hypothetical protein
VNVDHRAGFSLMLATMLVLVAGSSLALDRRTEVSGKDQKIQPKALNPQPEVPSKGGTTNPKALNPQPEVPSKGEKVSPKALNPQPEVPSKPKKKKKKDGGQKKSPETESRK